MTLPTATPVDEPRAAERSGEVERAPDWPGRVFWVGVVVALPLALWFGRDHWFFLDEWRLLTRDGLGRPGYLDGHNGHWITVLVFDYRLNFHLWGLTTYLPYQLPVVLAHLGAAVLLRAVMLRAGVRGWVATAATLVFVFFGSGRENITFGFQLSLTGSLLAGLALFVLSDRAGPVSRRDGLAVAIGVAGLMTSSAFVAMLAGVGLLALVRRGPRVAAFYTVPLGLVYSAWYLGYGGDGAEQPRLSGRTAVFAARMTASVFEALAQNRLAGAVLAAVAAVGLAITVRCGRRSGFSAHEAPVLGLAAAWLVAAALTSATRANNPFTADDYDAGRYVHIGAALLLPAIAVGVEHLARRARQLGAAAALTLAVGVPGNLDLFARTQPLYLSNPGLFGPDSREILEAMAASDYLDDVPAGRVMTRGAFVNIPLTVGWLRRNAATGRIAEPSEVDPEIDLTATNYLVLGQRQTVLGVDGCPRLAAPARVSLDAGDEIRFEGTVVVTVTDGLHASRPRDIASVEGSLLRADAGPVDVVVRGTGGARPRVCLPAGTT